jgi:DNA-directed RNA polymerase specialized sigma24 family protein
VAVSETLEQQMAGIASSVARRYYSRCWWADLADLEQQAWVIVLEVLREYPPMVDTENFELDRIAFGAWAYRACMRQLSRYLWRASSPVSAGDSETKQLAGIHHGLLTEAVPDAIPNPEQLLGEMEIYTRVRPAIKKRIEELYTRGRVGPPAYLEATISIYLDGFSPGQAAKTHGIPVYDLYKTTEYMRGMMKQDKKLRGYVSALQEGRID